MVIKAVNPATGETLKSYESMTLEEVNNAIDKTYETFLKWRDTSFQKRAESLKKVASILREEINTFARLITLEMGKPIKSSRAEIEKSAWVCDYYAENAEKILKDEVIETEADSSFVSFQPLGTVFAIMPWNFPFWQVLRFAPPALMAGNTVILKHASNVPGCSLAIEDIFRKAGFPESVFKTLLVGSNQVNAIIENPHVKAVTFTGSIDAGRHIAKKAGEMLKKTVLELGGSDAYVILGDADLEYAATTSVASRLINSGQSCVAAKRFIIVEPLKDRFEELVVNKMSTMKIGDPMLEDTIIGPLARHDLRDNLHGQVQMSINKGAKCLLGGEILQGKGAFYPPTVLTNVKKDMPAYNEELFGPVAAIISARDDDEAVRIANDSQFGLGAAVFTSDIEKGKQIATNEIEVGCCFVNDFVKSDPRLPFGGIKDSGYGRELSHYGIKEFVNVKTIVVK